jgi:hypothetical protein
MTKEIENKISKELVKKENWAAVGFGVFYSGLGSKVEAEECAKAKGIPISDVRRLKDL